MRKVQGNNEDWLIRCKQTKMEKNLVKEDGYFGIYPKTLFITTMFVLMSFVAVNDHLLVKTELVAKS